MQCISCKDSILEPKELEVGLIVAGCIKCEGVLVPLMNYRYWFDKTHGQTSEAQLSDSDLPSEIASARSCPKCSRIMTKYQVGPTSNHQLDLCASCDEAWLDKGEWQLLKKLDLHGKLPKIFTEAWQRNIRKARNEAALDERYEKLIGEADFGQVKTFKRWLYQHPLKDKIKQFLVIAPE